MDKIQHIADRVEIEALRGEFADAGMTHDFDRLAGLFTRDGVWQIPGANLHIVGRTKIRAEIERLQGAWEYFLQNTHPGTIQLDGDTATGRAYVMEIGRFTDGTSLQNYGVYHDRYRRTGDGWRFAERSYQVRYFDQTPLAGSTQLPA
ncbi:nuclear transport factor 2 family protein [Nakamurella lactea]|jgi:ketosteroid isomerase-like protein|uniref:nuclear transport factor 2 family protein n=1 Tax=Nakamurella lactea TaxID=459515 RepID=UPI0004133ACE|nr:nuclear transport factor 2 family protein [Nakamurella lactea]